MFCRRCGKQLPENSNFCPCCGTEVILKSKKRKIFIGVLLVVTCISISLMGILLKNKIPLSALPENDFAVTERENKYFSEEEYNDYKQLAQKLAIIEKEYTNEKGYVKEEALEELWTRVKEKIEEEREEINIVSCSYNEENKIAFMKFKSGISYMFIPHVEGSLNSGEENEIITIEPYATDYQFLISAFLTWLDKEYNKLEYNGSYSVPASAQIIANSNKKYTYEKENNYIINENVTIEKAKTLAEYEIIIWEGHGGYSYATHSALATSEKDLNYASCYKYAEDLKEGNLIFASAGMIQIYALTPKFFDKYLGEMNDSLVFLGGCYTAKDEVLADSFLNKGACAVIGYTESVSMEYEMMTRANFFYHLSLDEITNDRIKDSMEYVWAHIGTKDPWGKEAAEMILFLPETQNNSQINMQGEISEEDWDLLLKQSGQLGLIAKFADENKDAMFTIFMFYTALSQYLPVSNAEVLASDPKNYLSQMDGAVEGELYRVPIFDLDWLCRNIFYLEGIDLQQWDSGSDDYFSFEYAQDGYMYIYNSAGDWGVGGDRIVSYEYLDDGTVYAEINLVDYWTGAPDFSLYVIGEIKEENGMRYWTFYEYSLKPLDY